MSPKLKAISLVGNMMKATGEYSSARECALIAARSFIINATPKQRKYWEEVIKEIISNT